MQISAANSTALQGEPYFDSTVGVSAPASRWSWLSGRRPSGLRQELRFRRGHAAAELIGGDEHRKLPVLAVSHFESGAGHDNDDAKLVHAKYDRETKRAYVELRDEDDDRGDVLVVAIFSYRTTARLSKAQIEQDIVRKARHMMKRAAVAI